MFRIRHAAEALLLAALATAGVGVQAATRFVSPSGAHDAVGGFATRAGAATNLQAAVDAAVPGDTIRVAPGRYVTGGRPAPDDGIFSRVVIDRSVTLLGEHGAEQTVIIGSQATNAPARCVWLGAGARLIGFTLTGGLAPGGGVRCGGTNAWIEACLIVGNRGVARGGGVLGGTLRRCTLRGNTADDGRPVRGGGAYGSVLEDCLLEENAVPRRHPNYGYGAAAAESTLIRCRIVNNLGYYGALWRCTATECHIFGNAGRDREALDSALRDCTIGADPLEPERLYVTACALAGTNAAHPVLRLPTCFSSGMVLQQGLPLPIWGWAKADSRLTVDWNGRSYAAVADARGFWRATLDPRPATAAPCTMTLAVAGGERTILEDILVGEVWLCSGQSNMYMPFARTFTTPADFAGDPLLRSFRVDYDRRVYDCDWPDEQPDVAAAWKPAASNTIPSFSGVAFIFGRRLRQELQVPVGLITSTCGDSMAEGWTSMAALRANPANRDYLADWERSLDGARRARDAGSTNRNETAALTTYLRPGRLFNGMIAPLIPYGLRGVLWYQGEGNHRRVEPYASVLRGMILDWRRRWGQRALPFLSVQLPNSNIDTWPRLRQSQAAATQLPEVHVAVTWDVGERLKIHPRNKRAVGERLALLALNQVYGRDSPGFSPVPAAAAREGRRVRVTFTNTYGGLVAGTCLPPETEPLTSAVSATRPGVPGAWIAATAGGGAVTGFELAGTDGRYHPARAELAEDAVLLACEAVPDPRQVRFAWAADPQANLYNGAGLPAAPFERAIALPSDSQRD
jgi:sialate O-acetylesterase